MTKRHNNTFIVGLAILLGFGVMCLCAYGNRVVSMSCGDENPLAMRNQDDSAMKELRKKHFSRSEIEKILSRGRSVDDYRGLDASITGVEGRKQLVEQLAEADKELRLIREKIKQMGDGAGITIDSSGTCDGWGRAEWDVAGERVVRGASERVVRKSPNLDSQCWIHRRENETTPAICMADHNNIEPARRTHKSIAPTSNVRNAWETRWRSLGFRMTVEPGKDLTQKEEAIYRQKLANAGPTAQSVSAKMLWFRINDPSSLLKSAGSPQRRNLLELKNELEENTSAFFRKYNNAIGSRQGKDYYILLWNTSNRSLVNKSDSKETWRLARAYAGQDDQGLPAVGFEMDETGSKMMHLLTKQNLTRMMAITVNGQVYSWATIRSPIRGNGILTKGAGGYSADEVSYLLTALRSSARPTTRNPEETQVRVNDKSDAISDSGHTSGAQSWLIVMLTAFGVLSLAGLFCLILKYVSDAKDKHGYERELN